jgi:hypothetical protein
MDYYEVETISNLLLDEEEIGNFLLGVSIFDDFLADRFLVPKFTIEEFLIFLLLLADSGTLFIFSVKGSSYFLFGDFKELYVSTINFSYLGGFGTSFFTTYLYSSN